MVDLQHLLYWLRRKSLLNKDYPFYVFIILYMFILTFFKMSKRSRDISILDETERNNYENASKRIKLLESDIQDFKAKLKNIELELHKEETTIKSTEEKIKDRELEERRKVIEKRTKD